MSAATGRFAWRWLSVLALAAITLALPGAGKPAAREKTADAKIAFYRARIGGPGTYPAYARLGLACLEKYRETGQAKFHAQALAYLRQSLCYQPNFEALLGLALALSERHQFKEALPYAEEALGAMPSDLEAAGVLFDIRLALGRIQEAEAGLDVMLQAKSGFQSLSRLAALREYRGDFNGALAALLQAREQAEGTLSDATRAWLEVRLGSIRLRRCDASGARAAYERALKLVPGGDHASEHLAEWHAAQGHWPDAERLFQRLLRSRPTPHYRLALAEVCRAQNRPRDARREERRALKELRDAARDDAQDVFRPLALLLLERDDGAAEGLHWARRDWEIRQDALAADTLSWALWRNGSTAEALQLSAVAVKSGSRDGALLLHAGFIHSGSGRVTEGRTMLKEALACTLAFGPGERRLADEAVKLLRKPN